MIISLMLTDDSGTHYGVARDIYDEKHGYGRRDMYRLFKRAEKDLKVKLAFFAEKEKENGKQGNGC